MVDSEFRFTVMGPIRAWAGDTELVLGSPQQRALLALLLIKTGQVVPLTDIANFLWRDDPPTSAANIVHHHVSTLRRLLEPGLSRRHPGSWLLHGGSGYRLAVEPGRVDLHNFRSRAERARKCRANGEWRSAASSYMDALALRQGPAGVGCPQNIVDNVYFNDVENDYRKAVVEATEIHLRIGDGQRISTLVQQTAERFPWDEQLQAAYIRTLSATGRQVDALTTYQALRLRLADELGIEPGSALRAAQTAVLRQDPRGENDTSGAVPPPDPGGTKPTQLPPDLPLSAGREAALARILAAAAQATSPVVTPISGMAGTGKTVLAVHAARRLTDHFPDGQLFLNLHGFDDGEPMSPAEALRHLLESLGLVAARLPLTLPGLMGLYRSLLTDRRVVIVLDNALNAQQVRPLLPATPGCMAIVTSRNMLAGLLVTNSAEPVTLAEMTPEESLALLGHHLGPARVAGEQNAADDIVDACAGLPVALASVAARASLNAHKPLSEIAAELKSTSNSLEAFFSDDPHLDLRWLLSCSYRRLDDESAQLFRRLALRPSSPISVEGAAALAGMPPSRCRRLLTNLVAVCLLTESTTGLFEMHGFVADFAYEALQDNDSTAERVAAEQRFLDHYRPETPFASTEDPKSAGSVVGQQICAQRNSTWPQTFSVESLKAG